VPQGTNQLVPNMIANRDSNFGSNRGSINLSEGQGAGPEFKKNVKKGPAAYPAEYHYQADRWLQLYQDPNVLVTLKRTNAVLSKNKIYAKVNIAIENLMSTNLKQVSLKIKNSPASSIF
jgi:hypothetical protein